MKKILILVMVLSLSLIVVGCNDKSVNTGSETQKITNVDQIPLNLVEKVKQQGVKEAVDKYYENLPQTNNRIDPKDVYAKIQTSPDQIFILDIRDLKGDRNKVPGATHAFWYEVGKNLDKLPKDKTIIVHCWTGQAGMQVATTLRLLGYDAWGMNGGWTNGWLKEGLPTETYNGTTDIFDDLNSAVNAAKK